VKRPYATEYAKMLKEIHDKTIKLTGTERSAKENDIRAKWAETLTKSRTQDAGKEADITFRPVNKDGTIAYFDETNYYGRDSAKDAAMKATEHAMAAQPIKELHVGDFVVIGYESGIIHNDAYVLLKASKVSEANR